MNSSHHIEPVYVVLVRPGNIYRSPMAEITARDAVKVNTLADDVLLAPCGIGGWHVGEPADERAQAELENAGCNSNHTATQLGDEHMDVTLFIAMDESHINSLLRAGVPEEKIRLVCSFDPASSKGAIVAGPYYGGLEGSVRTRNEIEATTPGTVAWLCGTLALASER